jgi:hypothetical protein
MRPSLTWVGAWISRAVLLGGSLLCLAWVAFLAAGRLQAYTPAGAALLVAIPIAAAVVLAHAGLRQSRTAVMRIARELLMMGVSLLAVETLIAIWSPELPSPQQVRMRTAAKLGVPFDPRTKSQVTAELRSKGIEALPGISREWPQVSSVRQQLPPGLFPLSDASNAPIVECNERGSYLIWRSDEFGFNNPPGLILTRNVDVAAVGASFTLGHCLPPEQSMVGRLRRVYPRLANFGIAGSGTLAMLASFREYVEPLRPRLVLWIMHPRTADTQDELKDPTLVRYLDPAFAQHLIERRAEIDRTWREIGIPVQYEFDRQNAAVRAAAADRRFARIPFFAQLRLRLRLDAPLQKSDPSPPLDTFVRSIQLADTATRSWGGTLVVVIMPLYAEIVAHQMPPSLRHDHLTQVVTGLGVPVIDAADLFARQHDPAHLYTMRINNHPGPDGHELLASFVAEQLARRFPNAVAGDR